jgi:hypothetical protein
MVSSNIPLHQVEAANFRKFLEKYKTHPILTESTLRKNYLASCYDDTINKIRNSVGKNKIRVCTYVYRITTLYTYYVSARMFTESQCCIYSMCLHVCLQNHNVVYRVYICTYIYRITTLYTYYVSARMFTESQRYI